MQELLTYAKTTVNATKACIWAFMTSEYEMNHAVYLCTSRGTW